MHAITKALAGMIQRLTIMASPSCAKIRLCVMRTFCDAPERIETVKRKKGDDTSQCRRQSLKTLAMKA